MSDFEFVIPLTRNELLEPTVGKYVVNNLLSSKEIDKKLKEAQKSLKEEGFEFIIDKFDTYYSVLHHENSLNIKFLSIAYEDLHKALLSLNNKLGFLLEDKDNLNDETKQKFLNMIKMTLYLYVNFVNFLLGKIEDNNSIAQNKKFKNLQISDVGDNRINESKVISALNNFMQRDLGALWNPQRVDEIFITMIAEVPYRVMQCYSFKTDKELQNITYHFLGLLLKDYSQGYSFIIRIVSLIKLYEHVVPSIANGIQLLIDNYNCKGVLHDLIKEMIELLSDVNTAENVGTKRCCVVLTELAVTMPNLLLSEIMFLNTYLAHDSYTLRNSILAIIVEVLLNVLHKPNLSDEEMEDRNALLMILEEHIADINGLVRNKVFAHFSKMHEANALPIHNQISVLEKAVRHLRDKVVAVRKAAASCIKTFITHNIYGADLSLQPKLEQLEKQEKELQNQLNEVGNEWLAKYEDIKAVVQANIDVPCDIDVSEKGNEEIIALIKSHITEGNYLDAFKLCKHVTNSMEEFQEKRNALDNNTHADLYMEILGCIYATSKEENAASSGSSLSKLIAVTVRMDYMKNCVKYIQILNSCIPHMNDLLESISITDFQAAVDFFVTANHFNIDNASKGILEMVKLMQRPEQDRKDAVVNALKELFLETDAKNIEDHKELVINRLIKLRRDVSYANLPNLTHLISTWSSKGILDNSIIDALWQKFKRCSNDDGRVSLDLLKMASLERLSIINRNIRVISTIAFKERKSNLLLVISACDTLATLGNEKQLITNENPPFKIKFEDELWTDLTEILIDNFMKNEKFVLGTIIAIINLFYSICSKPDKLCDNIIKTVYEKYMNDLEEQPCFVIIRLIQLFGEVAIKQFNFLDEQIYKEMKRRNYILENKKNNKKSRNTTLSNLNASQRSVLDANQDDEYVMEGAQAEDVDGEFILATLENHTVTDNSLLSCLTGLIVEVCEKPSTYNNQILQTAAATTLGRYMTVSSKFCKQHIQLFITLLENTPYISVKMNILALSADLLERFPNIIEPWVPNLYNRLKDENGEVRQKAFYIISNLVLKAVIRAQSNISQMAIFIVSEDRILAEMSKQFFAVLAEKDNTLYNLLPDIFSYLCNNDELDQDKFSIIMTYLFQLLDKRRYVESLVDRFCLKFKANDDETVLKNAAFCLNLIQYNEKALKRLLENFPIYKHSLHNKDVYGCVRNIINVASKDVKTEIKTIAAEIDERIKEFFEINNEKMPVEQRSKKQRKGAAAKRNKRNQNMSSDDTDDENEPRNRRNANKAKKTRTKFNLDSSEDEVASQKSTNRRNTRNKSDESSYSVQNSARKGRRNRQS